MSPPKAPVQKAKSGVTQSPIQRTSPVGKPTKTKLRAIEQAVEDEDAAKESGTADATISTKVSGSPATVQQPGNDAVAGPADQCSRIDAVRSKDEESEASFTDGEPVAMASSTDDESEQRESEADSTDDEETRTAWESLDKDEQGRVKLYIHHMYSIPNPSDKKAKQIWDNMDDEEMEQMEERFGDMREIEEGMFGGMGMFGDEEGMLEDMLDDMLESYGHNPVASWGGGGPECCSRGGY